MAGVNRACRQAGIAAMQKYSSGKKYLSGLNLQWIVFYFLYYLINKIFIACGIFQQLRFLLL